MKRFSIATLALIFLALNFISAYADQTSGNDTIPDPITITVIASGGSGVPVTVSGLTDKTFAYGGTFDLDGWFEFPGIIGQSYTVSAGGNEKCYMLVKEAVNPINSRAELRSQDEISCNDKVYTFFVPLAYNVTMQDHPIVEGSFDGYTPGSEIIVTDLTRNRTLHDTLFDSVGTYLFGVEVGHYYKVVTERGSHCYITSSNDVIWNYYAMPFTEAMITVCP